MRRDSFIHKALSSLEWLPPITRVASPITGLCRNKVASPFNMESESSIKAIRIKQAELDSTCVSLITYSVDYEHFFQVFC